MKKLCMPFLIALTALQASNLVSIEEHHQEIARGGRGGGRAGAARVTSTSVNRTAISRSGVGSLQRTPSMSRAGAYRAGQVAGAAATSGGVYYGGSSSTQPAYYYPSDPYYYYYYGH